MTSLSISWRSNAENFPDGGTRTFPAACFSVESGGGTDIRGHRALRDAGAFSDLLIRVTDNDVPASSTVTLLESEIATNLSVSITASTTGDFVDTSNTAVLTDTDEIAISGVIGSGGTGIDISMAEFKFEPDSDTVTLLGTLSASTDAMSVSESTEYFSVFGRRNGLASGSESVVDYTVRGSNVVWRNMDVAIGNSDRTTDTVCVARVNAADGNQNVTFAGGVELTEIEDTSNEDALIIDDDINWAVTLGTGSEVINMSRFDSTFVSTDDQWYTGVKGATVRINDGLTRWWAVGGAMTFATDTEADVAIPSAIAFTAEEMTAKMTRNTNVTEATYTLRINGANGNMLVVLDAIGFGNDDANDDEIAEDDDINFQVTSGAGTNYDTETVGIIGRVASLPVGGGRLLLINPPSLDGGFSGGMLQ